MAKITLWDAMNEWLSHLEAQGMSRATLTTYRSALHHAVNTWGVIDVRDIDHDRIDEYFARRDWSTSTHNMYLGSLRGFLSFCRTRGYLPPDEDPTAGWKSKKVIKRPRTWLSLPELRALLESCQEPRDRALVAIGTYSLLRSAEITNMRVADIDLARAEFHVLREKTSDRDVMPIVTELDEELRMWLPVYEEQAGPLQPDWYLVPRRGSKPMRGIPGGGMMPTGAPAPYLPQQRLVRPQQIVRAILRDAGYDRIGDGCHVLRRSGAECLREQLADHGHDNALRLVQAMLGHASISTTETYLSVNVARQQRNALLSGRRMFDAA